MALYPSIFGSDDRIIVPSATLSSFPERIAVRIDAIWNDGFKQFGTGIWVGDNDVLTAGHVVYSAAHGGEANAIEVQQASSVGVGSDALRAIEAIPFAQGWTSPIPAADLAVLHTDVALGRLVGWAGIQSALNKPFSTSLIGTSVVGLGYPVDIGKGKALVETQGSVDAVSPGLLLFRDDLDLAPGQSGSGLLANTQSNDPVLIGVLDGYRYSSDANAWENVAIAIGPDVQTWLRASTGDATPWSVNPERAANQIGRLYLGVFGRLPDAPGLNYWIQSLDSGTTLADIANAFTTSDEFSHLHGNPLALDNGGFLALLYEALLGRAPDSAGMSYWQERLIDGLSRGGAVAAISESDEAVAKTTSQLVGIHPVSNGEWSL